MVDTPSLGPRAARIYRALRGRILNAEFAAGVQLPSQPALAKQYATSRVTLREALSRLESEGLVVSEQGRGTFVRATLPPAVLIVDDEEINRDLLGVHAVRAGFRVLEAVGPEDAVAALEQDRNIVLVLTDVRMPRPEHGIGLINTVRRRWPDLPLAAVTSYPQDLHPLFGTAECPALIVPKPIHAAQVESVLRLAAGSRPAAAPAATPGTDGV